jgi:hypothetical protein
VTRGWEIRRLAHEEVEQVEAVLGLTRLGTDGFYLVAWAGSLSDTRTWRSVSRPNCKTSPSAKPTVASASPPH